MIKSKKSFNTQHLTQEARQRASAIARRRRSTRAPATKGLKYAL